jgi:hypothetical protein
MSKAWVFDQIRRRGGTIAVVEFSGGNDEGGADHICINDATGATVAELPNYVHPERYDYETGRSIYRAGEEELAQLVNALTQPINDEYGSFAGEFSVQGTVIWDARTDKVTMGRSERQWGSYEETEVDW